MGTAASTASNAATASSALFPPRLLLGRKRPLPSEDDRGSGNGTSVDGDADRRADPPLGEEDDDDDEEEFRRRRRPKRRRFVAPLTAGFLDVPVDCLARVASHLPLNDRAKLAGTCRTFRRCEEDVGTFRASREERIERIVEEAAEWFRYGDVGDVGDVGFDVHDDDAEYQEEEDEEEEEEDRRSRSWLPSVRWRTRWRDDDADAARFCRPLFSLLTELDGPWGTEGLFRVARLSAPMGGHFARQDLGMSRGEIRRRRRGASRVSLVALRWLPHCADVEEYAAEAYGWIERPVWSDVDAEELLGEILEGQLGPSKRMLMQELEATFVLHLLGSSAVPYLWKFFKEGFKCRYRYLRRIVAIV